MGPMSVSDRALPAERRAGLSSLNDPEEAE